MKVHKVDQKVVQGLIASTIKFAPQQKGGDKYKVFLKHINQESKEVYSLVCEWFLEYEYSQWYEYASILTTFLVYLFVKFHFCVTLYRQTMLKKTKK